METQNKAMDRGFYSQFTVYYEDTDSGKIVYYANYLKFAERARTEALRSAGFTQSVIAEKYNGFFVVKKCTVDFLEPAKLDDKLEVKTNFIEILNATVTASHEIRSNGRLLCSMLVRLAFVTHNSTGVSADVAKRNTTLTVLRIPPIIREAMKAGCKI